MNIHKIILSNKYLRYTPFWCWYRLMIHLDCHLDDRFVYQDFWNSINEGYAQMMDDAMWLQYFGAKPEKILLSRRDYDKLVEVLNNPPEPSQGLIDLMKRPSPFIDNDTSN